MPGRVNRLFREMEEELNSLTRGVWGDVDRDFVSPTSALSTAMGPGFGATDVKETDSAYELHVDVPSLSKEDVKVNLDRNGVLTISGERQASKDEEKDNFRRVERVYGSFTRRFQVPDNVDKDKIKAKVEHGVLRLELPKASESETHPHTITVE
jgi:HSP20 family protein